MEEEGLEKEVMESNENMLTVEVHMDNNRIMFMEKLKVSEILHESIKIPYNHPKFMLLAFFTSLPLAFAMLFHEIVLQTIIIRTTTFLVTFPLHDPTIFSFWSFNRDSGLTRFLRDVSPRIFQLGLLYCVPLLLLGLINTINTVKLTSTIYAEKVPVKIIESLLKLIKENRFKGPLVTSTYVLVLNSLALLGFVWAISNFLISPLGAFFTTIYGIISMVLLAKWMEWSSIWNISIIFSVLEDRNGIEGLGAADYISNGNEQRGLCLMQVFFAWRTLLRLAGYYMGGNGKWGALAATSVLSCVGDMIKWVVCTVYFYDCKKRVMEKKVGLEQRKVNITETQTFSENKVDLEEGKVNMAETISE